MLGVHFAELLGVASKVAASLDLRELVFVSATVAGQRLLAKRDGRGYYVWIAANVCGFMLCVRTGRWISAGLYVYLGYECVRSVRMWRAAGLMGAVDAGG